MLAHRTAQHWGLDTYTASAGPDQGCIVAVRTSHSGRPPFRLSDLKVTIDDNSATLPSQSHQAAAPRVLTRRRNGGVDQFASNLNHKHQARSSQHIDHMNKHDGVGTGNDMASVVEEREQDYVKARARIFGSEGKVDNTTDSKLRIRQSENSSFHLNSLVHQGVRSQSDYDGQLDVQGSFSSSSPRNSRGQNLAEGAVESRSNHSQRGLRTPESEVDCHGRGETRSGNTKVERIPGASRIGYESNFKISENSRSKAQLRNRQEDLSDPDFRRNRIRGPRFDPGFGDEPFAAYGAYQSSMYLRPTYATEFPQLGTTNFVGAARPAPGIAAGGIPAGSHTPVSIAPPPPHSMFVTAYPNGGAYPAGNSAMANVAPIHPSSAATMHGGHALMAGLTGTMPFYVDPAAAAAAHHHQAAAAAAAAAAVGYAHYPPTFSSGSVGGLYRGRRTHSQSYVSGKGSPLGNRQHVFNAKKGYNPLKNGSGSLRSQQFSDGSNESKSSSEPDSKGIGCKAIVEGQDSKNCKMGKREARMEHEYESNIDEAAADAAAAAAAVAMQGVGQSAKDPA